MSILVKERRFYSTLVSLAVPISLQTLISFGVNVTDTVMVGGLGEYSIAGVALANQFSVIFQYICFGIAGGIGVLTAQFWGKGDREAVCDGLSIGLKIALIFCLLFVASAAFFPSSVMRVYTTEEPVIAEGALYLRWLAISYLFYGGTTMVANVLQTVGIVKLTLLTNLVSFVLNIFLNWMFIFGNLGAPRMGVAGAALATSICRLVGILIIVVFLFRIDKKVRFRLRMLLRWNKEIFRKYIKIGLPVLISDVLLGVGNNMTSVVLGRMGAVVTSASAIAVTINQLTYVFLNGVAIAAGVMTGNTIGEGKLERAKEYGKTLLVLSVAVCAFTACMILLIRGFIFKPFQIGGRAVKVFNVGSDTELIAGQLLYTLAALTVFWTLSFVLTKGILRAGGDTRFLMVADVLFLWLVSVPLGFLSGLYFKWAPFVVYFFLKSDEVIKTVWCLFRFSSGKWIRNVTVRNDEIV